MGQNYLRSLLALAFQAFLIMVCVGIYAVLVQNIATETDIIWLRSSSGSPSVFSCQAPHEYQHSSAAHGAVHAAIFPAGHV